MAGSGFELGTDGPSRILVGVDGTQASLHAAAYAAGMARRHGATLVAVFVVPPASLAAQTSITAGALLQTQHELAEELRATVAEASRRLGIDIDFVVRHGNPYHELIDVATSAQVDAVVIGASTKSGRRFVGSLAARLVRDAVWPITVVP